MIAMVNSIELLFNTHKQQRVLISSFSFKLVYLQLLYYFCYSQRAFTLTLQFTRESIHFYINDVMILIMIYIYKYIGLYVLK